MLNEFLFTKIEEKYIGNFWFQQNGATCHTAEATLDILRNIFEDRIISRRADVVWPLRSWDLTPLGSYLWGAVKDKCYADKPETIDFLRTIFVKPLLKYSCTQSAMCLKIWPIVLLHGQPRQPFEWNYFPLLTGRIILSNKKSNLRKYSVFFFKHFPKKKMVLGGPCISSVKFKLDFTGFTTRNFKFL